MNLNRPSGVHTLRPPAHIDRDRPRVALYSHDAQGLGHIRRNLSIAKALQAHGAEVLLLTGAPEAVGTRHLSGIDLVAVPALKKGDDGTYTSRTLGLDVAETVHIRAQVLRAAVAAFAPDLLVVDKHPRGFRGEMEPALTTARRLGTKVVLGLRDVLDEPAAARAQWARDHGDTALATFYDEVWLYADPQVHDAAAELGLRLPVRATGYLAAGRVPTGDRVRRPRSLDERPYVLGVLGGGSDGGALARAFARATYPAGHQGVLITGPNLPADDRRAVRQLAADRTDLVVHTFREDLEHWYGAARAVVSMGGYNTVCEVLAAGKSLLVVPRVRPRAEQLVRARALAHRGALEMCHPDDLSPGALDAWFDALNGPPAPHTPIDLDGLARVPDLAAALLNTSEVARSA